MKKILVPTDFSPIANKALEVAVSIARPAGAVVEVLNVSIFPASAVGSYYTMYGGTASIDETWDSVMKEASEKINELASKYEGVTIKPVIEESNERFIDTLLNHQADLIVMGSHGADGLKELLAGSNSEEVVRLASCPVLVVKDEGTPFKFSKVVFAVDLTHHEAFIKKAVDMLPIEDAEKFFVFVDTDMKAINYAETRNEMQRVAEDMGIKNAVCEVYEARTVQEGIIEFVKERHADLLVMYTHGRTGISHFFRGSIAEDVVNHSPVSVFTYVEH